MRLWQALIEDNIGCWGRRFIELYSYILANNFCQRLFTPSGKAFIRKIKQLVFCYKAFTFNSLQERKLEKFFEIARPHESYLAVIMVLLFSASFCKFFSIIKTRKRVQHNKQLSQRNKIFLSCFSKIKN